MGSVTESSHFDNAKVYNRLKRPETNEKERLNKKTQVRTQNTK